MTVGVLVRLQLEIENELKRVRDFGLSSCQLCGWKRELMETPGYAQRVKAAIAESGVAVSSFWCGWSGPAKWNFTEGPQTLGLVPVEYREQRVEDLIAGSDFAAAIGVNQVATHMGFIPETPCDPLYTPVVEAIRRVAEHCKKNGQWLLFETGQETPTTMIRTFADVGTGNLGVNLDPANLLMYGKANPVDSLDIFGQYVMDTHCKDGFYPTDGYSLGKEARLGDGRADFSAIVKKLNELGYKGALTIEREISGEKQSEDIRHAMNLLNDILAAL